mgnify:CR=1 FL=1
MSLSVSPSELESFMLDIDESLYKLNKHKYDYYNIAAVDPKDPWSQ